MLKITKTINLDLEFVFLYDFREWWSSCTLAESSNEYKSFSCFFLQVPWPIRSNLHSRSPVFWLSLTQELIINPLLRHPMPMSPSLLSPMLIPQPGLLILLFLATTRETSPLDSCGGFWPVKFCVFVVPSLVNCNGMLCRYVFTFYCDSCSIDTN